MLHVPYSQGVLNDLIANVASLTIEPAPAAMAWVKDGRLKAIAVTGKERLAQLPDTPALAEALPNFVLTGWQAVWVPAGTPDPIIRKLHAAFKDNLNDPAIQKRYETDAVQASGAGPEELAEIIRTESEMWGKVIRERHPGFPALWSGLAQSPTRWLPCALRCRRCRCRARLSRTF